MRPHRGWLHSSVLPMGAGLALLLVLWSGAVRVFGLAPSLLPGPERVLATGLAHRRELLDAAFLTTIAALGGLGLSTAVGCLVAFAFAQHLFIRRTFFPYAIFLQTVPVLTFAPLVIRLFGYGLTTIVIVSFIVCLFPIIVNVTAGLTTVSPDLLDLFRLFGATRWQVLIKLRLPNALPYLVSGIRIASGLAVLGALVGESFAQYAGGRVGLGYLLATTFWMQQTELLYAAAFLSSALGVMFFAIVGIGEALVLRRRPGQQEQPCSR